MRAWLKRRRVRRYKIRAWKDYHKAVSREEFYLSNGLGHPEWIEKPSFPDPRRFTAEDLA